MTDNARLAKWQEWEEYHSDINKHVPDYLNDDAAAMSLLDTLVNKGYQHYVTYTEVWKHSCIVFENNNTEWSTKSNYHTRNEAIIAACLEVARRELEVARSEAFVALIEMRDSPNDAPIPDKFEPSDCNAKRLIEAREALAKLKAMSGEERVAFGETAKAEHIERSRKYLEKALAENSRLEDMAAQVRAWTPPTKNHQGLQDFMLQQIDTSKNGVDYSQRSLAEAQAKPATAYYVEAVTSATRDIKYHTEENVKEVDRVNGRSEWVQQLRASI